MKFQEYHERQVKYYKEQCANHIAKLTENFNYYNVWVSEALYKDNFCVAHHAILADPKDGDFEKALENMIASLDHFVKCWMPEYSSSQLSNLNNQWKFEIAKRLSEEFTRELDEIRNPHN